MLDFLTSIGQKTSAIIGSLFMALGSVMGGVPAVPAENDSPASSTESVLETAIDTVNEEKAITQPQITTASSPTTITDLCINLEGIQTAVPAEFTLSNGSCIPKVVIDVCPNIDGAQASVPSGLVKSKEHNVCLTGEELDKLSDSENEKEKATEDALALSEEKKRLQTEINLYNRYLLEIESDYYNCEPNGYGSCDEIYTPQNPLPQVIKDIIKTAPQTVTGGGNTSILSKSGQLTNYVKEKINFILFDLQSEYSLLID